jgi:hypothetical protein
MKTRWKRAQATKHIEALVASGKSVEAFAAEQQLPAQRLRYWQKRLAAHGKQRPECSTPTLLPVRVTQSAHAPLELVLGVGCVVRVSRGFDEETLLRVVSLFGSR